MPLFNPGSGGGGHSHPRARAQRLEMLIGILGFFTILALIQTVVLESQSKPAGRAALVLLCLALGLGWAIRARRATGIKGPTR